MEASTRVADHRVVGPYRSRSAARMARLTWCAFFGPNCAARQLTYASAHSARRVGWLSNEAGAYRGRPGSRSAVGENL